MVLWSRHSDPYFALLIVFCFAQGPKPMTAYTFGLQCLCIGCYLFVYLSNVIHARNNARAELDKSEVQFDFEIKHYRNCEKVRRRWRQDLHDTYQAYDIYCCWQVVRFVAASLVMAAVAFL